MKNVLIQSLLKQTIAYASKDPINNFLKLLNAIETLVSLPEHKSAAKLFRKWFDDKDSPQYRLIERVSTELNPKVREKLLVNYFVNSGVVGIATHNKKSKELGCNVPWAILMDPTSACNLRCIGCWAGEYNKNDSLDFDTLDRIINEGKELGIYMYIYSGGEPLVRRDDLLKLALKHNDCMFLSFTNGTLIDDEYAAKIADAGNFMYALSVEGFEKETDMRRGAGTFRKVMKTMDILKKHGIGFGFSTCYHKFNAEVIASEEYTDFMVDKGCMFGWYFTYMPIGKDADVNLIADASQREHLYYKIHKHRETKPIFLMDFWNDGEYVGGCIAGGRKYLHINANGDVEPCAFVHYSNVNIKKASLVEALQSPIFKEYGKEQPFNDNQLRPCPLFDNPEKLRAMVKRAGAHSTQPVDKENVDDLCDKCVTQAESWAKIADKLWNKTMDERKEAVNA